ncbi:MAG: methionine synthase, partial [Candidatus Marinimicrobia bacterium CG_4_9_14_3_um_filter_48_9]
MNRTFLDRLKDKIIVFDGAMGTSIQRMNLTADDFWDKEGCNELLVLSKPKVIETIHASFLEVGCDVVETDTFGGTRVVLDEYDLRDKVYEINKTAAALARGVANDFSTPNHPRYVAGSMGP